MEWTDTIVWKMTKQLPIENEIKKRKWRWIGHAPSPAKPNGTTQGRGEEVGHQTLAQRHGKRNKGDGIHHERNGEDGHDRKRWRSLVDGLCSQRATRHKQVNKYVNERDFSEEIIGME